MIRTDGELAGTAALDLAEMLHAAAAARPEHPALVFRGEAIGYGELHERVGRLAHGFASLGLGPGDPVALLLPDSPDFVTAFFALARLGAVAVPLSPRFKEAEIEFVFRECGVRAVVAEDAGARMCRSLVSGWDPPVEVVAAGAQGGSGPALEGLMQGDSTWLGAAPPADADCVYEYSSGSTGRPKRVPRTHRHLRFEADSFVASTGIAASDRIFSSIPLFHTYGMGCCMVAAVRAGATLVLLDDPHPFVLKREHALRALERERPTVFPAVPFIFRLLAEAPGEADLSSVRLCFSATQSLPRSTFDAFHAKFGIPIRQLYGCTEAGAVTVNMDDDPFATVASVGTPIDGVEVRIAGPDGETLEPGHIGEILIQSPAATPGYAGMDELNREAFVDGFFVSADRGRLDDEGRLFITGRRKLLIDVKGDKVDPIEVEDVLAVHPKVHEVVVVGVDSGVEGEDLIKAVVVASGDCQERELIRYCRERLADYKVPHSVEFRDEIPRNQAGRVLRKYLV